MNDVKEVSSLGLKY